MVKEESWSRQFKNLANMCSIDNPLPNFDRVSLTYRLDSIRYFFSRSFIHVGIGTVCVCLSKDLSVRCVKGLGSLENCNIILHTLSIRMFDDKMKSVSD